MSVKVIIEGCRLSYPALFKPKESQEGGDPKYQVTILIPKTDAKTVQAVHAAIQQEMAEAVQPTGSWKGAQPPNPQLPLYDGDQVMPRSGKPWGDECKGHWVLRASSPSAPDVVDEFGNKAMDASKFYAGCYCHYSINIAAYNNKQVGIGAYLNCVMFDRDGEPLEAHASAKDDFANLIAARTGQQAAAPMAGAMNTPNGFAAPGLPYAAPMQPQMPAAPMPQAPVAPQPAGFPYAAPMQPQAPVASQPQPQMPGGFGGFGGFPQQ